MKMEMINVLLQLLGFIGLIAIGLLPLRSWQVVVGAFKGSASRLPRAVVVGITVLIVGVALWCEGLIVWRTYRCLIGTYCGPSIGIGWAYLAGLGCVYLVFEAAVFVLNWGVRGRVFWRKAQD